MNNGIYQKLKLVYQKPEIRVPLEIILSVFASLFLIMTAVRPTLVTVAELRKKIEDQTLVEKKLDSKIKSLIQARQELDENEVNLPLFEEAVPVNYTYANLAKKIEILAIEENVKIESLVFSSVVVSTGTDEKDLGKNSKNDSLKNPVAEWVDGDSKVRGFSINFGVVASEQSLVNLLSKIENLDRVLSISTVEISKVKDREIVGDKLRASGKIDGYYLVNKIEQE